MTTLIFAAIAAARASSPPPCRNLSPEVKTFLVQLYTAPTMIDPPTFMDGVASMSNKTLRKRARGAGACLEHLYETGSEKSGLRIPADAPKRKQDALEVLCRTDTDRCIAVAERDLARIGDADKNAHGDRCLQLLRFTKQAQCLSALVEGLAGDEPRNASLWLDALLDNREARMLPHLAKLAQSKNVQVSTRARIAQQALRADFAPIIKATYSKDLIEHYVAIRILAIFGREQDLKNLAAEANHPNRDLILRALQPGGAASLR